MIRRMVHSSPAIGGTPCLIICLKPRSRVPYGRGLQDPVRVVLPFLCTVRLYSTADTCASGGEGIMPSITSACTCTVDGVSGLADTRYEDYSFTGCGAHIGFYFVGGGGAGYERTRCYVSEGLPDRAGYVRGQYYVTSPNDCPGEEPYIPEGLKDDKTLGVWKDPGAAWKECYDGYRCEAWWGSLDGQLQGDPVVLNAPLDWPDCCALCSDTNTNGTTTASCAGWSFHPATGSCQLMSEVSLGYNASSSWGVNGTVHGYPGYFEAPVTGCWTRDMYDLCGNMNLGLLFPGAILVFVGLFFVCLLRLCDLSHKTCLLIQLLRDGQSRLEKALCMEVTVTTLRIRDKRGRSKYATHYKGTFMTRDGSLFELSDKTPCPSFETKMFRVLLSQRLKPSADPAVAARCQTPQGLRSHFAKLLRSAPRISRVESTSTIHCPEQDVRFPCLNCLLLVDGGQPQRGQHQRGQRQRERHQPVPTVLLVGILGEDRITCIDHEALGLAFWKGYTGVGVCLLSIATGFFVTLCVVLLSNQASQVMAVYTFPGTDFRAGAVVGLVLCVSVPVAVMVSWVQWRRTTMRLIQQCPPAAGILPEHA